MVCSCSLFYMRPCARGCTAPLCQRTKYTLLFTNNTTGDTNVGMMLKLAASDGHKLSPSREKPKCAVMFHWGETDQSIPIEAAKKAAAQHPSAQSFVYPAGHGFNCDQRGSYHAESAKLARSRSLEFLRKHIG